MKKSMRQRCIERLEKAQTADIEPLKMGDAWIVKGVILTEDEWLWLLNFLKKGDPRLLTD